LARAVGRERDVVPHTVARQLAAIGAAAAVGTDEDIRREAARAHDLGISAEMVTLAMASGARLRHVDVPAA
jgi:alkylhydroperoxidase/carboxymuconolactone decarboxylase family protein YurZ